MKKALALIGSALMVVGTAAPAMAQDGDRGRDRDSRPGECSVTLDTSHRGRTLDIDVDASRRAERAVAYVNFDSRRGDSRQRVDLDNRGDGSVSVDVPRRADSVDVTVVVREGRRDRVVTCDASLDLNRRGRDRV